MSDTLVNTDMNEALTAEELEERRHHASQIVRRKSAWGFGAGCIPIPFVDMATVTGVQLSMINQLSQLYGVPFSEHPAKNIVAALLGSIVPNQLAWGVVGSSIKALPGVGPALALFTMPGFSSAVTYAIGRIYIQHLEAGGNLLNFDAEKMREHFRAEFEAAQSKNTGRKSAGSKAA